MTILFNGLEVNQTQKIILTKDTQTYKIVCASINSNPDVNLTLYDTNTLIPLSTNSNSILQNSCNSNICTNILQVDFQFIDNRFDSMTSLTCAANSSNPLVPLSTTINRNTLVLKPGKE